MHCEANVGINLWGLVTHQRNSQCVRRWCTYLPDIWRSGPCSWQQHVQWRWSGRWAHTSGCCHESLGLCVKNTAHFTTLRNSRMLQNRNKWKSKPWATIASEPLIFSFRNCVYWEIRSKHFRTWSLSPNYCVLIPKPLWGFCIFGKGLHLDSSEITSKCWQADN